MKELTIVTPTYNRENTLPKVYESLLKQTLKNFIWLVIDDGSIDNTKDLINKYISENKICIQYYYKENGGKASALNKALDIIKTNYFCCLDSDDAFFPETVSSALKLLNEEQNNNNCCGILSLRTDKYGNVLGGKTIPSKYKYISVPELYSCIDNTELICFYKKDLINDLRFPEIKGEKFISPTWFQYKVSETYKFRVTNAKMCICEYLSDGLTKNKKGIILKNPIGYTLMKKESLKHSRRINKTIKHAIMYDCGCIISKNKNWLKDSPKKLICFICYPISYIVYKIRF